MNVELFSGHAIALQARLAVLLAGPATTIDDTILTHIAGSYIIIWS